MDITLKVLLTSDIIAFLATIHYNFPNLTQQNPYK